MKPDPNEEFKAILSELKRLLRDRGISYRELAQKLEITESGVKKIFASKDGSYRRLAQIANILGFQLLDILQEIQQVTFENAAFSIEQQKHFMKSEQLFHVYYRLVIERLTTAEAQSELGLTDQTFFSLLKRLDDLHLIRLLPENKIKIPSLKMVRSFGNGPFLNKLYRDWGQKIVADLATPQAQASGYFIVRSLRMKEDTYNEFIARLQDLDAEFIKRGIREMKVSTKKLKIMRWMSLTDQQSFI